MAARHWLISALVLGACKGGDTPKPDAAATAPGETAAATSATTATSATADVAAGPADAAPATNATGPATGATAPTAPADAAAGSSDAGAAATGELTLVSAGAEPLRALRYAVPDGQEQAAELVMTTELELEANGQKMPTPLPKTRLTLSAKGATGRPAGELAFTLTISDADLAKDAAPSATRAGDKLAEVVRSMKGLAGDKVASTRGVSRAFALSAPAEHPAMATPALKSVVEGFERAIDQMMVPLPEEPVGVGATWTHRQSVVEAGMTLEQVTTYELVAAEGDTLTVKFALKLQPPDGKLVTTVMGGVEATMTSLTGGGEGTIQVVLGKALPVKLEVKNQILLGLDLKDKGPLGVDMRLTLAATSP